MTTPSLTTISELLFEALTGTKEDLHALGNAVAEYKKTYHRSYASMPPAFRKMLESMLEAAECENN